LSLDEQSKIMVEMKKEQIQVMDFPGNPGIYRYLHIDILYIDVLSVMDFPGNI
jgi:hypothetical protein